MEKYNVLKVDSLQDCFLVIANTYETVSYTHLRGEGLANLSEAGACGSAGRRHFLHEQHRTADRPVLNLSLIHI